MSPPAAPRRAAIAGALLMLAGGLLGAYTTAGHGIALDRAILFAMRVPGDPGLGIGPRWLREAVVQVTVLGSPAPMILVTFAGALLLFARGDRQRALLLILASWSARIGAVLLKDWVARPRPEIVPQLVEASSTSYPSAHAMNSAAVCLCVAGMLVRAGTPLAERRALLGLALAATALIGLSRIYLGVHWPSDVLAGWLLGSGLALLWCALAWRLRPSSGDAP